jgi:hypothetical protein
MEDRENNNAPRLSTIVNAVWEALRNNATNVVVDNAKAKRPIGCECNAALNFYDELNAKIRAPGLIPRSRFDEICTGCATE